MTFRLGVRTARAISATVLLLAISCNGPTTASDPSTSPTEAATADGSAFVATAIPSPRTTPPGTPAPTPDEVTTESVTVDRAQIDKVVAAPTATPSPEPGLWRIDGYVVDESGAPLGGVCVVIGPLGCRQWSPHTDDRGYWKIDIAEGHATFDFYFEMPGKKTVWWHTTPDGPTQFNVKLVDG